MPVPSSLNTPWLGLHLPWRFVPRQPVAVATPQTTPAVGSWPKVPIGRVMLLPNGLLSRAAPSLVKLVLLI